MAKIYSGIVLFNPDLNRLLLSLSSISPQVDKVILIDNGSSNIDDVCEAIIAFNNVLIIKNGHNRGLATALNQICALSYEDQANWVLTLDQDTVCPNSIISVFMNYISDNKLGIICPAVDYEGLNVNNKSNMSISYTYACMTSGSLTNTIAWKEVGGFREDYFIDYVDNEFCMKLRLAGYKILRVNDCTMHHQLGNIEERRILGLFTKHVSAHSPLRYYYMTRNNLSFIKEYKTHLNVFKEFMKLGSVLIYGLLYTDSRKDTFLFIKKGIYDAYKGRLGQFEIH